MDNRSDAARAARRASLAEELIACAAALRDTLAGSHLDAALAKLLEKSADRAGHESARAVRDMSYAAVRQLGRLRFLAERLNSRRPAPLLGALQLVALSQLLDGRRAPATIIDQAAAAAGKLPEGAGNRFSAGFINATLRRFERERNTLLAAADLDPQAVHNHPDWWIELVRQSWPGDWQRILAESMSHAPLTLRVNRRFAGAGVNAGVGAGAAGGGSGPGPGVAWPADDPVAEAGRRLVEARMPNRRVGPEALVLERAAAVTLIPGFTEGAFTVQDAGAQLAAPLLRPEAGDRILDACAAPGGKTTHLLQLADCRVLALDRDPVRASRIGENLRRENLPTHPTWPPAEWGAVVQTADATRPDSWWNGEAFDKILLDAPCSASGIVRRHPDVPWQRRRGDIATLARQQGLLLRALWPLLTPGGTLLYVTCSIFPDEGEGVTAAFCSHQEDCVREPVPTPWSDGQTILSQLLPTSTDVREHDGFFFALLSKQT